MSDCRFGVSPVNYPDPDPDPDTQHALRPFIDSETNHKRHFIKVLFINKGIGIIDLLSIFKHKSITLSIPTYFQNSEPPIICCNYNSA